MDVVDGSQTAGFRMRLKAIIALAVVAVLAGAALVLSKARSHPLVTLTLRIAVTPADQAPFVAGQANSAKFKYLAGKESGLKPALAQKLSVRRAPDSSLLEVQLGALTRDEGTRYAAAFAETLQWLCGTQAQVALAGQTIR